LRIRCYFYLSASPPPIFAAQRIVPACFHPPPDLQDKKTANAKTSLALAVCRNLVDCVKNTLDQKRNFRTRGLAGRELIGARTFDHAARR